MIGILSGSIIEVPLGYVSDTPLFGTATWDNSSVSGLGVTSGIYTWIWGSGDHADSLTLFAGVPVSTPEPTTWLLLGISSAAITGVAYRRRNLIGRHMNR